MADKPTGSPPLPDDQQKELSKKIENVLGEPPQDPGVPEPAERFKIDAKESAEAAEEPPAAGQTVDNASDAVLSDPDTDKAVDDIAVQESDEVLAAHDQAVIEATPKKLGFKQKVKNFFQAWWHNKKARYGTLAGASLVLVGLLIFPPSRYFLLNTASVRASASLNVLDNSTQQPLKNVQVELGGVTGLSDENGNVTLRHIKLGNSQLVISKRAFAVQTRSYTVGWGSNPLGTISLTPVGSQYTFTANDFLSGKPIAKAQATSDDANAQADDKGKIVLTIDKPSDQIQVTITANGYRDETLSINSDDKGSHNVKLVPSRKEVFVSKRSGKFDVYTIDLDGKNEKVILTGTGNEQDNMVLAPHPTDEIAALVSSRDNVRNADGFLLSTLTLIDLKSGQATKVTQSERVQLVDWIGSRLVYVQVTAGASAANPKRERLMAYDYQTNSAKELATSNYFNDVLAANGQIYFAPSSAYQSSSNKGFFRINADATNRATILGREVWNMFRTGYDDLSLAVGQDWYTYHLGDISAKKTNGAPANLKTRVYIDNPNDKNSLWIDNRDGKGVLLLYDLVAKKDKALQTQNGLVYPVRWLNQTTVIYRIHLEQETADYALSTQGGQPLKLRDVTNTAGISSWYYY